LILEVGKPSSDGRIPSFEDFVKLLDTSQIGILKKLYLK
jgi:hypothetical protein